MYGGGESSSDQDICTGAKELQLTPYPEDNRERTKEGKYSQSLIPLDFKSAVCGPVNRFFRNMRILSILTKLWVCLGVHFVNGL